MIVISLSPLYNLIMLNGQTLLFDVIYYSDFKLYTRNKAKFAHSFLTYKYLKLILQRCYSIKLLINRKYILQNTPSQHVGTLFKGSKVLKQNKKQFYDAFTLNHNVHFLIPFIKQQTEIMKHTNENIKSLFPHI